jgi:hypothetical protein
MERLTTSRAICQPNGDLGFIAEPAFVLVVSNAQKPLPIDIEQGSNRRQTDR